jgi:hypothetical protein
MDGMAMERKILSVAASLVLLSGCATVPDVSLQYPKVAWRLSAQVVVTVACNEAKSDIVYSHGAIFTPSYSADPGSPLTLNTRALRRWGADVELAATFTEDGRLRSINHASTGQGEAIAKSFVAFDAARVLAGGGPISLAESVKPKPPIGPLCDDMAKWGGGKPVSIVYAGAAAVCDVAGNQCDGRATPAPQALALRPDNPVFAERLEQHLPRYFLSLSRAPQGANKPVSVNADGGRETVPLSLQEMMRVTVRVCTRTHAAAAPGTDAECQGFEESKSPIATMTLTVPDSTTYTLPIPKAALFGRQTFSLTLGDAGNVTSVSFGRTSGTPGALNALTSLAGIQAPTAEIAALRAEADLIVAQQRLVACRAQPSTCK